MSENLPVSANDLFNAQMPTAAGDTPKDLAAVASSSFLPNLSIGYGTSDAVKKKIAQMGEFVLAGQTSLGSKVEVILLQYRIHACRVKNKVEFMDHCYHVNTRGSIAQNAEYQKYTSQASEPGVELIQGSDVLFWIPAANAFAVMFFKKTLAQYAAELYKHGAGGRLVAMETVPMENRTRTHSWYGLTVTPLNRGVKGGPAGIPDDKKDIVIPGDLLTRTYGMFMNPSSGDGVEKDSDGGTRDR